MHNKRVLIIGEVFVDTHLDLYSQGHYLTRLGGIFHAIRACSAFGITFAFSYYAPNYLLDDINKFSQELNSTGAYQLGIVNKAPNVFLIGTSDESKFQGYDNILVNQTEYIENNSINNSIKEFEPTDILIFPGRYNINSILEELEKYNGNIHIDLNYDCPDLSKFKLNITNAIISTSSNNYARYFELGSYDILLEEISKINVQNLIVKENRGGSFLYSYKDKKYYDAPAFLQKVMHSVGVGDVYDVTYILGYYQKNISKNLRLAALCSVMYSKTMDFYNFKNEIGNIMNAVDDNIQIGGVRVPWFIRKSINIYLAAPDFEDVDVSKLNELVDALNYHNFTPRLPIRENGQVSKSMSKSEELQIYYKDIEMLNDCTVLIATLLFNDQGTLAEIGMFYQMGKKVIIFDPYFITNNMFLKNSCDFYCTSISETIDALFFCSNRSGG